MQYTVEVIDSGEKEILKASKGDNLLTLLHEHDYGVSAYCGGQGVCGKCTVVLQPASEPTANDCRVLSDEQLAQGVRLACQVEIGQDLTVVVESDLDINILTDGFDTETHLNPAYEKRVVTLETPTIEDQRDLWRRLQDELAYQRIEVSALRELSDVDVAQPMTLTHQDGRVMRVEAGDTSSSLFGAAVDIGTTTIAIYLVDLVSGREVGVHSLYNPQRRYGADVISRVNYTLEGSQRLQELQSAVTEGINDALAELTASHGIGLDDIVTMTVVGNTLMLHALLGISGASIASAPYIPVFAGRQELRPVDLGLRIHAGGTVALLPSISGYVGADVVGDLLAVPLTDGPGTYDLVVDIGTNGEIVVGSRESLLACATAAGPAFEGANITFGMAGISGAISQFAISDNGEASFTTIGGKPPKGLCGSGIVDVVAVLSRHGFLDGNGTFVKPEAMLPWQREMMSEHKGQPAFMVAADVLLTQKDVREVQLAKGAVAAGIRILLKEAGISFDKIGHVYLAGGFGNYVDPASACLIGLLPAELEQRIVRIGNGAGTGAKKALVDRSLTAVADELCARVRYIELSTRLDFQTEFVEAMMFAPAMAGDIG